jgi:hypothetical protein
MTPDNDKPVLTDRYFLEKIVRANIGRPSELINQFEAFQKEVADYISTNPITPVSETPSDSDKDLIIHGLKEGSDLWKWEYDCCRGILQELVDGNCHGWERAKEFLKTYQHNYE